MRSFNALSPSSTGPKHLQQPFDHFLSSCGELSLLVGQWREQLHRACSRCNGRALVVVTVVVAVVTAFGR